MAAWGAKGGLYVIEDVQATAADPQAYRSVLEAIKNELNEGGDDAVTQLTGPDGARIELIADRGLGGLTHDAVDAGAQVPVGSTRELFPTRDALVEGVTERCIDRELEMAAGPSPAGEPSAEVIAGMFDRFADRALGEDRAVTLARYALHAEAARTPALHVSRL